MALLLWLGCAARADFILETATLGATGLTGGYTIDDTQFLGARFSVTETYAVTAVGGHLAVGAGTYFAAIITIEGPDALPQGDGLSVDEVVAVTTSGPTDLSDDIVIPLSVVLPPGDYALVFGSGMFGTQTSDATMTGNNLDLPDASRFYWDGYGLEGGGWIDDRVLGGRFFVVAEAVPEPGIGLFPAGGLLVFAWRRRRRARL